METLKQIRKRTGLTQIDAARICGVSRRTYQTYEEKGDINDVYDEILAKLKEMGITEKGNPSLLNIKIIKEKTSLIFAKYPSVRCAYLFGSYARGEATVQSDVDIVIVEKEIMGLEFYSLAVELEESLGKSVDLLNCEQLTNNEGFLAEVLTDGVKIYGRNNSKTKN